MILVGKLNDRSAELSQIVIHQIFELVAGEDCLFLKNADIAPRIDDLCLDIPKGSIADQISVVVKEAGRTYDFPVP